jgi:hypothetical protein
MRAKTTVAFPDGSFIHEGKDYRSDHPFVKRNPDLFESVDELLGIEQAVKTPGRKRRAAKPQPVAQPVVEDEPAEAVEVEAEVSSEEDE